MIYGYDIEMESNNYFLVAITYRIRELILLYTYRNLDFKFDMFLLCSQIV